MVLRFAARWEAFFFPSWLAIDDICVSVACAERQLRTTWACDMHRSTSTPHDEAWLCRVVRIPSPAERPRARARAQSVNVTHCKLQYGTCLCRSVNSKEKSCTHTRTLACLLRVWKSHMLICGTYTATTPRVELCSYLIIFNSSSMWRGKKKCWPNTLALWCYVVLMDTKSWQNFQ
jgi:hypothetical protein